MLRSTSRTNARNRFWFNLILALLFGGIWAFYVVLPQFEIGWDSEGTISVKPRDSGRETEDSQDGRSVRRISVFNKIGRPVSLYYDDKDEQETSTSLNGMYLHHLEGGETVDILATEGDSMFATLIHGISRVVEFKVSRRRSKYELLPDKVVLEKAILELQEIEKQKENEKNGHLIAANNDNHNYKQKSFKSGRMTTVSTAIRREERVHPAVNVNVPETLAMPARFRSLYPKDVDMWYDNGSNGVWQGRIRFGRETSTTTYEGHEFYFTLHDTDTGRTGKKGKEVGRWKMKRDQSFYVITDPNHVPNSSEQEVIDETNREIAYMEEYENRTGRLYLSSCRDNHSNYMPRSAPVHFMWPADNVGDIHSVVTAEGFWHCFGGAEECQDTSGPTLELEVLSKEPRAFVIHDFLSDFEIKEIINESRGNMHRSSVGEGENSQEGHDTRTSRNTWLPREKNDIMRSLFKRAADLLQIDQSIISNGGEGIAEQMQVVHYRDGQRYDPHYDWGATRHSDRYITLLLYLTDMAAPDAGGQTAFPKGVGPNGSGFSIHPGRGSAVLFYNLLPDGNSDDRSLHAATPVTKGEKYLANFWVWDPVMKR
jgi:prolyl 4-hydroxylase